MAAAQSRNCFDFKSNVCHGLEPPVFDLFFFFKILFIYSRETQREAETQAEGEAGSMQGAQHGTRSRDSRIALGPKAGAKLLSHPGIPRNMNFYNNKCHTFCS